MSSTMRLGKVCITPKGAHNPANTYEYLDVVTADGMSYIAKADVPAGTPISHPTYWQALTSRGPAGTTFTPSVNNGTISWSNNGNEVNPPSINVTDNIPAVVTDWLNTHINTSTDVIIDDTLTIAGAAADAKKTGDEIGDLKSQIDALNDEVFTQEVVEAHDAVTASETITKRTIGSDGAISSNSYSNNVVSAYIIPTGAKEITIEDFPGSTKRYCAFYTSSTIADSSASTCIDGAVQYDPGESTVMEVPATAVMFALRWDTSNSTADIGKFYVTKKLGTVSRVDEIEDTVELFGTPAYVASVPSNTAMTASTSIAGRYIAHNGAISTTSNEHSIISSFAVLDGTQEVCLSNFPLQDGQPTGVYAFYSYDETFSTDTLIGSTHDFTLGVYDNYITVPNGAKWLWVRWYDTNGSIGNVVQTYKGQVHSKLDDFQTDYYLFDTVFEVGSGAEYGSLNDAITAASHKYPAYRKGGLTCEIRIKSGTVINEQIAVVGMDLSYITITSEDEYVGVNLDGFNSQGLNKHDLRNPNVGAFIGGENGAGLPKIGTLFKVTQNTNNIDVVGYFANRSSKGVVLSNCGFDGFGDGCISNNESSITIREGIARNNTRYGVHARHNGEVSARSCDCTNNGVYGAYADRVANLDVREADVGGSDVGVYGAHASNICACATHADGCRIVATAETCAVVDCSLLSSAGATEKVFVVNQGGIMNCVNATITSTEASETNITKNTLTSNGIIWG